MGATCFGTHFPKRECEMLSLKESPSTHLCRRKSGCEGRCQPFGSQKALRTFALELDPGNHMLVTYNLVAVWTLSTNFLVWKIDLTDTFQLFCDMQRPQNRAGA